MSVNLCKKVVMGEAMGLGAPAPLPALASVSALLCRERRHPCRLFSVRPGRPRSQGGHDSALGKRRTTRVLRRISSLRRLSLLVLFLTHHGTPRINAACIGAPPAHVHRGTWHPCIVRGIWPMGDACVAPTKDWGAA